MKHFLEYKTKTSSVESILNTVEHKVNRYEHEHMTAEAVAERNTNDSK